MAPAGQADRACGRSTICRDAGIRQRADASAYIPDNTALRRLFLSGSRRRRSCPASSRICTGALFAIKQQYPASHGRFGKDGRAALAGQPRRNVRIPKAPTLSKFPTGAATPASIVDALKAVAGDPPKVRASFAKGRCVRGTYVPSDRAAEITKSQSFTRPSRVLARFSVDGGNPKVADTNGLVLRGFSFRLGDDDHRSDILAQSAPVHFARTLDQMLAFLKARIPGPDGKPDVAKVKAFSAANPETLHQANYIAARAAARELCRHDLLGRARLSRNECQGRDAVHQVQGRSRRRTTSR